MSETFGGGTFGGGIFGGVLEAPSGGGIMPPSLFQRDGEFGIAKQSAFGVAASNPTYVMPVIDGLPEWRDESEVLTPAHQRLPSQSLRKYGIWWEAHVATYAWPASLPLMVKGLLASEVLTGTTPKNHAMVFDTATDDLWMTLFSRRPGGLYERYADGLIESVMIGWEVGSPVHVELGAAGLAPLILAAPYTAGATESELTNWLTYIGASVLFDWNGPAITSQLGVERGSLLIERPLAVVQNARGLAPIALVRGAPTVRLSLDFWWESYEGYRAWFAGTLGGSTPGSSVVHGALDLLFTDVSGSSSRLLRVQVPDVPFRVPSMPVTGSSGPARLTVEGEALRPASGKLVTLTVTNSVATAY